MKLNDGQKYRLEKLIFAFMDELASKSDHFDSILSGLKKNYRLATRRGALKDGSLNELIFYAKSLFQGDFIKPINSMPNGLDKIKKLMEDEIENDQKEKSQVGKDIKIQQLESKLAKAESRIDKLEQQVAVLLAERQTEKAKNPPLLGMFTMKG